MGSFIKINDTLKISKERGFPSDLNLESHTLDFEKSIGFIGKEFEFYNVFERLYNRPPARVFLVEEMSDGSWLFWGNAMIVEQTVIQDKTKGIYKIVKIYEPEFQKQITIEESPTGKSYFKEKPTSLLYSSLN